MGLKVGDRVAYNSFFSYAEYTCVPAAKLIPVPDVVGLDVATACVVQGMTAHYLTHSAHADLIQPGEWMLVHGAGGGTCQWAAQMAKIKGYKVIGTAAKGKADIARSTGVDELILLDETPGTACVARARAPARERERAKERARARELPPPRNPRVRPLRMAPTLGHDRQEILIKL